MDVKAKEVGGVCPRGRLYISSVRPAEIHEGDEVSVQEAIEVMNAYMVLPKPHWSTWLLPPGDAQIDMWLEAFTRGSEKRFTATLRMYKQMGGQTWTL